VVHIWRSLKSIVEEYPKSMAYDGYHLGLGELRVAANVSENI
jgi:hypothetical protein